MALFAARKALDAMTGRTPLHNAATDCYGDLMDMGAIDPTKVTRPGLRNAATITSLVLMTDWAIPEAKQPAQREAPVPGG